MRSEDDSTLLVSLGDLLHHLPHESASFGIHAGRWLVEQDDRRIAKQGDGNGKLSLVSTTESLRLFISVVFQVKLLNRFLNH